MNDMEALAKTSGIAPHELATAAKTLTGLAAALRMTPRAAAAVLLGFAQASSGADGRSAAWHVRLRILDAAGEVTADTDDERPFDDPGAEVVYGLPAIATWASDIVASYHSDMPAGAATALFAPRVPSLRVSLARSGQGRAVWAIRYEVDHLLYTARVDVQRASQARGTENRAIAQAKAVGVS